MATVVRVSRRIATLPNAVTLARLLVLPIVPWLLLVEERRTAAAVLLGVLGTTDWVDGWLARRFGQVSEFGAVFDPVVDRLLFIVGAAAVLVDGSVPAWFLIAVGLRELAVGGMMTVATAMGMPRIPVSVLGELVAAVEAGAPAAAPVWEGQRGHPVLFGPGLLADLGRVTGDAGAREILKGLGTALALVPAPDAGVLFDIDQPADLTP